MHVPAQQPQSEEKERHHELESLHQAMGDLARVDEMDKILARFGEVQE